MSSAATTTTKTTDEPTFYDVTVIGVGAMGGGMARCLLDAPNVRSVVGYDRATRPAEAFYEESGARGKAVEGSVGPPARLRDAVSSRTNAVILALVDEDQCEEVCFGDGDGDGESLSVLLSSSSNDVFVVSCSTTTAAWVRRAADRFRRTTPNATVIDCPVSGGPARARAGDLSLFCGADGDAPALARIAPLLRRLGDLRVINGGVGRGSAVKTVHQLLAGVHIVAAAEALSLAAAAGLDTAQMHDVVLGAAGNSWMFADRGRRMLDGDDAEVRSALDIFVKDLDIVHREAKRLRSPVPLSSAALQQFVSGQSLGLGRQDDSSVVRVYENVTGANVAAAAKQLRRQRQTEEATENDADGGAADENHDS